MKNRPENEVFQGLPDDRQLCEMILRLSEPYQLMAWVMIETGLRVDEVAGLAVRQLSVARRHATVEQGTSSRSFALSDGLVAAVAHYLDRIRPRFEGRGRWRFRLTRTARSEGPVRFSDALLFPAWAVPGYDGEVGNLMIPSAWFVDALADAAAAIGYDGPVHTNTLRHAAVKRWLDQGIEVAELHQRLGHRDLLTTLLLVQALQHGGLTFTTAA